MAITIFFVLNGAGVVFLLYVLANFRKEGRQPKNDDWEYAVEFGKRDWGDAIVVRRPISHAARGGLSVIPFQVQRQELRGNPIRETISRGIVEVRGKRTSTR